MPRRLSPAELAAYDHIPPALAQRVRVLEVPVLAAGTSGMTLGRFVLLRSDSDRAGTSTLLAHELVHVRQWHELGVPRFLTRYLCAYARNMARHRDHDRAYRAIPLEAEAYDAAARWARGRMGTVA